MQNLCSTANEFTQTIIMFRGVEMDPTMPKGRLRGGGKHGPFVDSVAVLLISGGHSFNQPPPSLHHFIEKT